MWPLVDNNFDPKLTHEILSDSRLQDTMIRQLMGYAILYDFKGYNLDFENINYSDKDKLTAFVRKISAAAHAYGLKLSMDVTPPSDSPNWSMVYDRAALAPHLDYLMIMAYDQVGRTSPVAGPVATYPWVERAVQNTLKLAPADKIVLGMPLYMRLWYESKDGRDLPQNISDWPAVVGAPPVKATKADPDKAENKVKSGEPMQVEIETAAEEAARQAAENKQGVIVPIDFDGDTYKRAAAAPAKKAAKPAASAPQTAAGGKAKLFVRTSPCRQRSRPQGL